MQLETLDENDFDTKTAAGVWLIDFAARWCAACRASEPALRAVADSFAGRLTVATVDVDAAPGIADRFGVMALPTFVLWREGRILAQRTGAVSQSVLARWLDEALGARAA